MPCRTRYNVVNCYKGYDLTFMAGMGAQDNWENVSWLAGKRKSKRGSAEKSWKNTVKELHFGYGGRATQK